VSMSLRGPNGELAVQALIVLLKYVVALYGIRLHNFSKNLLSIKDTKFCFA
jgi:hypothetical protein